MTAPTLAPESPWTRLRGLYQVPLGFLWLVVLYVPLILLTVLTVGTLTPALIRYYGYLWGRVTLALLSVRLQVEGAEKIATRAPRVLIFNHASMLDMFVLTSLWPPAGTTLAKKEFLRIPVLGQLWWLLGVIFIDRSNPARAKASIERAACRLRERRLTVLAAPEGTRSPTGELLPFKKGPFHLAVAAQASLLPVVIYGAHRLQPKGALHIRPGVIRVRVLDPVPTDGWSRDDLDPRVEQVRALFVRALAEAEGREAAGG